MERNKQHGTEANRQRIGSLFKYGLLQPKGITGDEARLLEIDTPLSWNVLGVLWFIYIKGSAVLVELFQYWIVGMAIAGALAVFIPWERVKKKMGHGGFFSNLIATFAGAIIPNCSCGIVPVLAGMVEAGIPLGPTMAFLIGTPMLNVPTVFITAGILGLEIGSWKDFRHLFHCPECERSSFLLAKKTEILAAVHQAEYNSQPVPGATAIRL